MLEVAGSALKAVSSSHRNEIEHRIHREALFEVQKQREDLRRERILQGTWHDGRLDAIAGNGIMSELGFGDELLTEKDGVPKAHMERIELHEGFRKQENAQKKSRRDSADLEMVESLPIVVVQNFEWKSGDNKAEELLDVISHWSASLVENQVCPIPPVLGAT